MKLDRRTRLDLAASMDWGRDHLAFVRLDVEAKTLMACDGKMAAIVPVEIEPQDVSGPLPDALFRETMEVLSVRCGPDAVALARPKAKEFVPLASVMPTFKEGDAGTFTVRLDAARLLKLACALGSDGIVALTFVTKTPNDPMLVETSTPGPRGTLMPCRK